MILYDDNFYVSNCWQCSKICGNIKNSFWLSIGVSTRLVHTALNSKWKKLFLRSDLPCDSSTLDIFPAAERESEAKALSSREKLSPGRWFFPEIFVLVLCSGWFFTEIFVLVLCSRLWGEGERNCSVKQRGSRARPRCLSLEPGWLLKALQEQPWQQAARQPPGHHKTGAPFFHKKKKAVSLHKIFTTWCFWWGEKSWCWTSASRGRRRETCSFLVLLLFAGNETQAMQAH